MHVSSQLPEWNARTPFIFFRMVYLRQSIRTEPFAMPLPIPFAHCHWPRFWTEIFPYEFWTLTVSRLHALHVIFIEYLEESLRQNAIICHARRFQDCRRSQCHFVQPFRKLVLARRFIRFRRIAGPFIFVFGFFRCVWTFAYGIAAFSTFFITWLNRWLWHHHFGKNSQSQKISLPFEFRDKNTHQKSIRQIKTSLLCSVFIQSIGFVVFAFVTA